MATMIDTLKFAKSFETAGFEKPQAEALTAAMAEMTSLAREDLVKKSDLQVAVADLRSDLSAKIGDAKTQLMWTMLGTQLLVIGAFVLLSNFSKAF